ncbi:MAG: hypothetical protein D6814_15005, partial [Calditrichaeota bacterium]
MRKLVMKFRIRWIGSFFLLIGLASCGKSPELPGSFEWGTRLPNRWILTPVGKQIPVGDLPLNLALSSNGRWLAVTNNGYSRQFISIIDVQKDSVAQELPVAKSFYGLAFALGDSTLFASGGGDNQILVWHLDQNRWQAGDSIALGGKSAPEEIFPAGLAVSADGKTLYVAENLANALSVVSLPGSKVEARIPLGAYPYDVTLTPDGSKAYISLWGGAKVSVFDTRTRRKTHDIAVGEHPNAMELSPDGSLLFVACSNTDEVWVIRTQSDAVVDTISLHPYAGAPYGSTPNGLALTPDGHWLLVANADNNDVAVIDVSQAGQNEVKGLIPVGWYPTAVVVSRDGKKVFVANGKGLSSRANPKGPNPNEKITEEVEYIGGLFWGTVSVFPLPDGNQLAEYTRQVEKNNGFNEAAQKLTEKPKTQKAHAIPRRVGEPSLIKHVIYIIKENRTYDQVLGDLPQGNGAPEICLFDSTVSPNHHALATAFVLLDNFYVDAEVSADGHEWSTGAIATDFVEKTWPSNYSERGLPYPSEGTHQIAFPTSGYIWEAAARKGVSYRSYGEFVYYHGDSTFATHPALRGHFDPNFRPWDLDYPDTLRAAEFIRELHQFEDRGEMPQFIIMRLPNDHTYGTVPGKHTPRAMVADNDLALGRLVEAVTRSKFWKDTAIFVVEDDAQNGPDHVDAHRTVALV